MAFWGIEVVPGKPYIHHYDGDQGRLHISQATLGTFSSNKRSILQCKVGDKGPINLCSLYPEKLETCPLNLEFEEDEEITFSVIGSHSVHLSGFLYGESEDGGDSEVDYSDDDEMSYSDDCEDDTDDVDDDDVDLYSSSPVRNSGVKIEEIVEDENPSNENGASKETKNKNSQKLKSISNRDSEKQIVKSTAGVLELESEDEDGFPIVSHGDELDDRNDRSHGKSLKRKAVADEDDESSRRDDQPGDPSVQINSTSPVNETKQNKKNKKKKVSDKEEMANEAAKKSDVSKGADSAVTEQNVGSEKQKEKKNKKKKKKENATDTEQATTGKSGSSKQTQEKAEAKPSQVRTFPNGLVIETLAMGIPDGKKAGPGKKISMRYIGKLKKNGKIFDSNIGRAPFKFRLGIGEVIKGWDVGVNGMRIGDKRRLTIPPEMGYGARGAGQAIPPNSWLVFDVELVDVK